MSENRWGNPAAKAFAKQHIRSVEAGGTKVRVNSLLTSVVAGMLADAGARDIMLPATITGYVPLKTGKPKPENYGIALKTKALDELATAYGFTPRGGSLVFTGSLEEARKAAAVAETSAVLVRVAPEMDPDRPRGLWSTDRPGVREVQPGDKGSDVYFYQLVMDAPDLSGTFDEWCSLNARYTQQRWGIPETGTITPDLWRGILPNPRRGFRAVSGDTGRSVIVLQAALLAYDWGELEVNGRFDKATVRAVNNLQETYGLRVWAGVGAPEWAALLGTW